MMHAELLQLAGAVALPPPFPSAGLLKRDQITGGPATIDVMTITQRISAARRIVRFVRVTDIVAVFVPTNPDDPKDLHAGDWVWQGFTDNDLGNAATQAQQPLVAGYPARGMVFVPGHAQVLSQDESGTTAAESAEYYALAPCCPT